MDGPGTGQSQTQESGTLLGPSLHIQFTGVPGIVGPQYTFPELTNGDMRLEAYNKALTHVVTLLSHW